MGRRRGQARLLAHLVAPAGRGSRSALPGHQVRHRPGHRKRLLLRRRFPDAHHRGRPADDRKQDGGAVPQQGSAPPPRSPQGRSAEDLHREGRPVQGRTDHGPRRRHHLLLYQRCVHGPLPRPAHSQHGIYQGPETYVRGRSLLARQREEQDADAYLRHLVPQEINARRVPRDDGGGQETRPPQVGQGPRTVHFFAARGPGPAAVAAQGSCAARPAGAVPAGRAEGVRLPAGDHAAHRQQGALCHLGPLRQIRQGLVPADPHPDRGRGVPAQTDELPAPLRDLPLETPFVQGAARASGGVRNGLPLRTVGRAARTDARARIHAGRRPPVRSSGSASGRVRTRDRHRALYLQDAEVRQLHRPDFAARPEQQGEIHRFGRELGEGRVGHHAGRQGERPHDGRGAGRSGLLRPEARLHGQGRHRPQVAAGNDPGGLQPPGAFRPHVQGR